MSAPVIDDPLLEATSLAELQALLEAQAVRAGHVVDGTVTASDDTTVTVEVPEAGSGTIPTLEFERLGETVAEGDEVRVYVNWISPEGPRLSRQKASNLDMWRSFETAAAERSPLTGQVLAEVHDGYAVDIGMKGFLPSTALKPATPRGAELVGEMLELYVTHADSRKTRVKLSQTPRQGPKAERLEAGEDIFDHLEEGAHLIGRVARITDFGAFVDIGGFDGLLHVNDLSYGRVNHPTEVVQIGDEIVVKVLKIDEDNRRVGLGMKQLQADPWTVAAERYKPDDRVSGRVISVTNYGAFVEVEPGLEGLVHVSEMSWKRVKHPKDAVKVGDTIDASVIRCDPEQQRLKLSMKALESNPWEEVRERYPSGTKITAKVRNVREWGIFLGVEEGIDGLVHISDLAWGNSLRRPSDRFRRGQEVEALVMEVDVERERMSLGIKQLTADPTRAFFDAHEPGDIISGKITGLADFGAFVSVADGLDGLVHISELTAAEIEKPGDIVKKGQTVQVMILGLDASVPKVSLSMKAAPQPEPEPAPEPAAEAAPQPEPESESEPEVEAQAEAAPEPKAEAAPEPEPKAEAAPEPEPEAEAAPEPEPEPEAAAEPVAEASPEAEPKPAPDGEAAADRLSRRFAKKDDGPAESDSAEPVEASDVQGESDVAPPDDSE